MTVRDGRCGKSDPNQALLLHQIREKGAPAAGRSDTCRLYLLWLTPCRSSALSCECCNARSCEFLTYGSTSSWWVGPAHSGGNDVAVIGRVDATGTKSCPAIEAEKAFHQMMQHRNAVCARG